MPEIRTTSYSDVFQSLDYGLGLALFAGRGTTLIVDSPVSLDASQSVPIDIGLAVARGGSINLNDNTLTILGTFEAGIQKVFTWALDPTTGLPLNRPEGRVLWGPNSVSAPPNAEPRILP